MLYGFEIRFVWVYRFVFASILRNMLILLRNAVTMSSARTVCMSLLSFCISVLNSFCILVSSCFRCVGVMVSVFMSVFSPFLAG